MIITCPSCSARFRVADQAIGGEGRLVRCGRCAYSWHQLPPADEAPLELGEQLPDTGLLERPPVLPASPPAATPVGFDPPDLPPDPRFDPRRDARAPEPAYRPRRRRSGGLLVGWMLFLLVLAALVGGGWYWRDKIVAAVPELGKLYDWLGIEVAAPVETGRLEISSYTFGRRLVDSDRRLVVAGEIVNRGAESLPVPALRARVLDQSGNEIMAWDFQAEAQSLAPGAKARFESLHEHPDYGGELTVEVGFVPAS